MGSAKADFSEVLKYSTCRPAATEIQSFTFRATLGFTFVEKIFDVRA